MSTHWADMGERSFVGGMRLLYAIYRWFGRGPFLLVLYPVVLYFWATHRVARQSSLQYLARMHQAHANLSAAPTWRHSLRHFLSFADTILDKALALSGRYRFETLQFEGRAEMAALLARGQGGLILTAHIGCLEMCQALAHDVGAITLNILVHHEHALKFNALLKRLSPERLIRLIPVTEVTPATAQFLSERIAQGEFVAIAGDRIPVRTSKTVSVPFLGHSATLPLGPYALAALLKCPLFFLGCIRRGRRHTLHFEKFADTLSVPRPQRSQIFTHYAARYAQKIESLLVHAPYEWFNFFPFWGG
jgi:predicted LPLAT superfamily acyltransferase